MGTREGYLGGGEDKGRGSGRVTIMQEGDRDKGRRLG